MGRFIRPYLGKEKEMYFKKESGIIFEYDKERHDLKSLKERFVECDKDGKEIKKKKDKKAK